MSTTKEEERLILKFLEENASEIIEETEGTKRKIRCTITNHQMPRKLSELKAHWTGRRYRREKKKIQRQTDPVDLKPFEGLIAPHKYDKTKVFCTLTKKNLNNDKETITKHVTGRKFKFLKTLVTVKRIGFTPEEEEAAIDYEAQAEADMFEDMRKLAEAREKKDKEESAASKQEVGTKRKKEGAPAQLEQEGEGEGDKKLESKQKHKKKQKTGGKIKKSKKGKK